MLVLDVQNSPTHDASRRTPHSVKNCPRVSGGAFGFFDSVWMSPVGSWVCSGDRQGAAHRVTKYWIVVPSSDGVFVMPMGALMSIPIPEGTVTRWPSTKRSR